MSLNAKQSRALCLILSALSPSIDDQLANSAPMLQADFANKRLRLDYGCEYREIDVSPTSFHEVLSVLQDGAPFANFFRTERMTEGGAKEAGGEQRCGTEKEEKQQREKAE